MKKGPTPNCTGSHGGHSASRTSSSDPGLCVTVISTTLEGTTAALDAARWLAKDLGARITLLTMQVVPVRFPLDKPPVAPDFTIKQQRSLLFPSVTREDVTNRICLCRDRDDGLRRVLRRRALVVIGGRRRWWLGGEERLEQALRRLGHHVIFVDSGHKTERTSRNSFPCFHGRIAVQVQKQEGAAQSIFCSENLR
jgi:hypothetical protein